MTLFKKTYREKIDFVYKSYKREASQEFFPQGPRQVHAIFISLAKIYHLDLENMSAKQFKDIMNTYTDVYTKKNKNGMEDDDIMQYLRKEYKDLVTDDEIAEQVLQFFYMNQQSPLDLLPSASALKRKIAENKEIAEIVYNHQRFDDTFGYDVKNPICRASVESSHRYLSSLVTAKNEKLYWARSKAFIVQVDKSGKSTIFDEYSLYVDAKLYAKIYICPYSIDTDKAPAGFLLRPGHWKNSGEDSEYEGDIKKIASSLNTDVEGCLNYLQILLEYEEVLMQITDETVREDLPEAFKLLKKFKNRYSRNPDEPTPTEMLAISVLTYSIMREERSDIFYYTDISVCEVIMFTVYYFYAFVSCSARSRARQETFAKTFLRICRSELKEQAFALGDQGALDFWEDRWNYYQSVIEKSNTMNGFLTEACAGFKKLLQFDIHNDSTGSTKFELADNIMGDRAPYDPLSMTSDNKDIDDYVQSLPDALRSIMKSVTDDLSK